MIQYISKKYLAWDNLLTRMKVVTYWRLFVLLLLPRVLNSTAPGADFRRDASCLLWKYRKKQIFEQLFVLDVLMSPYRLLFNGYQWYNIEE